MRLRIALRAFAKQLQAAVNRHEQIVEIMRDPAGEQADRFHLLRLEQRFARQFQLVLRFLALADVARDLCKTDRVAGVVVDGVDHHARAKPRAVLANPPALGGKTLRAPRGFQRPLRFARGAVLLFVKGGEMLADDFVGGIALDALGAGVPAGDMALVVKHIDGVIGDALDEQAKLRLAPLERRRAFFDPLFERFIEIAKAAGGGAKLGVDADAFDMRPAAIGNLADHRQLFAGPAVPFAMVDGHQRGQAAVLYQRHADGRADADRPKGRCRLGRNVGVVVVDDERMARAQIGNRKLAEVGEMIMADDRLRSFGVPVAADRETVLIAVHIAISANRDAQLFAHHAGGDRKNFIGIEDGGGLFAKSVEKAQPRFAGAQRLCGPHRVGCFDDDRQHTGGNTRVVIDRRIVEVHRHIFETAGAVEPENMILVGERSARKADLHHIVVEIGDLGPALAHGRSEQAGVIMPRNYRIAVIINHRALIAPQEDERDGRMDHESNDGAQAFRPAVNRPSGVPLQLNSAISRPISPPP